MNFGLSPRARTRAAWLVPAALLVLMLLPGVAAALDGHGAAAANTATHQAAPQHAAPSLGTRLPLWSALPFVGILLSIAVFPLLAPHFWHRHFPKVAAFWSLAFAVPFLVAFRGEALQSIIHIYVIDYIPFIILLWALFTVAGGIYVGGSLRGS
ncbi:MAG: sodium:proton antiporter, partial [bacterium]|nr:sodium:proton antiporter [bacterium]